MGTVAAPRPAPAPAEPPAEEFPLLRIVRNRRTWLLGGLLLVLLVAVREITHSTEITSSGTFGAALMLTIPILLAGLGGLFSERTGVVNVGLEGMMILGTWFGAWAGWKYGPWWGLVGGVLAGGLGGLLHAVACVTFGINQIVSGVAINILAGGVVRFLSVVAYSPATGGSAAQSPQVRGTIGGASLPFLSGGVLFGWHSPNPLAWLEARHWFLASDLGGLLRGLTSNVAWLTIIALALVPLTYWFLWKTPLGLRMRSAGEHPVAAESLGIRVYSMKYLGVAISGCLAGYAGAFLVLQTAGIYREGQTGGRGFIGLAAMISGNWRPGGVAAAAGLFGYADALQLRSDPAIHGLLLFVAIALGLAAAWLLARRRVRAGTVAGLVGIGAFSWFLTSTSVPSQFVFFTPHLTTLLVLSFASRRLRMPAADGKAYRRGQTQ